MKTHRRETQARSDTVHWLHDPADDVSCGPLACNVEELAIEVAAGLRLGQGEVALKGTVIGARDLDGCSVVILGAVGAAEKGPGIMVFVPGVGAIAPRPGAVVRTWGLLELTSTFTIQLRATTLEPVNEHAHG